MHWYDYLNIPGISYLNFMLFGVMIVIYFNDVYHYVINHLCTSCMRINLMMMDLIYYY